MIWMGWAIFPPPQSLVELRPDCKRSFRLRVSAHEADGSIEQLATMPSPVLRFKEPLVNKAHRKRFIGRTAAIRIPAAP
jgi:hypothetical protein